jgi:hypothetical protein
VTAIKEKPVVSKQAHVVEEVALSKQSGEREVTVSGTVRRQDVIVEDIDDKSGKTAKTARGGACGIPPADCMILLRPAKRSLPGAPLRSDEFCLLFGSKHVL